MARIVPASPEPAVEPLPKRAAGGIGAGSPARLLLLWAGLLFAATLLFIFLHECGHGFGARLDGANVSTGFNRVGDAGKRPSDPDFRSATMVHSRIGSSGLLGPFSNWFFAVLFTGLLLSRTRLTGGGLLLGGAAVANAWLRAAPMLMVFGNAMSGRLHLEDEVAWGLGAVKGLELPMPLSDFREPLTSQPELFLSEPLFYFWPGVSLVISGACLFLATRHLLLLSRPALQTRTRRTLFVLMPVLVFPPIVLVANLLDEVVRINW
jgi:hypothetical protein